MVSPKLRHRAWTLYLLMAFLAIIFGVVMFLLAGGWRPLSFGQLAPDHAVPGAAVTAPHL
jgi:hypothetical protein